MYLKDLSPDCKKSFLALARLLIAADGVFASEELAMLDDVAFEMGVAPDSGTTGDIVEDLCEAVQRPEARAQMLLELVSLAHIDDEYSTEERKLLREISQQWGVDAITLIRIETWAESRIQMSREAAAIIQEIKTWQL